MDIFINRFDASLHFCADSLTYASSLHSNTVYLSLYIYTYKQFSLSSMQWAMTGVENRANIPWNMP